jgi:FkbM family methyltransferase
MNAGARAVKETVRRMLPRAVKPHRILAGRLQGAPIVTSWHDYPGAILGRTERPLLAWFESHVRPSQTWIDVGAHYGYTAIALSRMVGPAGRVFAFEPIATTAQCVERTRELNGFTQLTVVPVALNASGLRRALRLPVVRGMADSTLTGSRAAQRINSISFDALWPSLCGDRPAINGVKIDVQGMELDVLRGMAETLRRWQPLVVVELHRGVDRQEVLARLAGCGYGPGEPIEPGEVSGNAEYRDDCSYAFHPRRMRVGE